MDCKQKTASISISSALKLIRSSSMFKGFLLEWLVVKFLSYQKKERLAEMETLCLSLSLVVHSLSLAAPFVATRCTTRCHSLSLDILDVLLIINDGLAVRGKKLSRLSIPPSIISLFKINNS